MGDARSSKGNRSCRNARAYSSWSLLLLSQPWVANADCSEELAEIDRRIATGRYPDQNVQVAKQMRASMEQMCAALPADARAAMMEGLEDVLPVKSEDERRRERKARSAELKKEREARKRAQAEAERKRAAQVSPVVKSPPTARTIAAVELSRDEDMYYTHAWDWELHDGNLRLLYTSTPDRSQYARPDWSVNVYVAEMTPAGDVTHQRVLGEQSSDQIGFALRRGHDELFRLRQVPRSEAPRALERWSITQRRLLATSDMTQIEWQAGGRRWRPPSFQVATAEGNLLFAGVDGGSRTDRQVRLAWFTVSPEARILGGDAYAIEDTARPWAWLPTPSGGGGLVVDVTPVEGTDLVSGLRLEGGARRLGTMTAHVTRERRLLVVGADGKRADDSVVIERDIMQQADGPAAEPTDAMAALESMQRQHRWIEDLRAEHDANRSTRSMNVGLRRVDMVRETARGFAVLTRVVADRDREPPLHGPWIVEFDRKGRTTGRIPLQALAEDLDARFDGFVPSPGGGYYVHAPQSRQIVRIDAKGRLVARRKSQTEGVVEEGLVADATGVWVFGHVFEGAAPSRVHLERIVF